MCVRYFDGGGRGGAGGAFADLYGKGGLCGSVGGFGGGGAFVAAKGESEAAASGYYAAGDGWVCGVPRGAQGGQYAGSYYQCARGEGRPAQRLPAGGG